MRRIREGLALATSTIVANTWLLEHEGKRFLVDTGHPLERPGLLYALWRAGIRKKGDLAGVLLTHRHSDHAGNAWWLRERFACPVSCHVDDAKVLSGLAPPPRLARGVGWFYEELLCRIEDRFPARCPIDDTWSTGAWRHGFQVFPVPGHTEGSTLLHHEPSGTLFTGDAVLAGPPPLRCIEWLRLAAPGFSLDVASCHEATRRTLEALSPVSAIASGHGPAVTKDVPAKLRALVAKTVRRVTAAAADPGSSTS